MAAKYSFEFSTKLCLFVRVNRLAEKFSHIMWRGGRDHTNEAKLGPRAALQIYYWNNVRCARARAMSCVQWKAIRSFWYFEIAYVYTKRRYI